MASVNRVTIVGNLGRDPETRTFPSGDQVCNVRIATTDKWKDKQSGEMREHTEWHRLVFNGRLAEIARLQAMVTSFVDGFAAAAESLHAANKAMRDAAPPDMSEQFGRDMVRHINIMGAHGDPDYLKGDLSCRHVDMRATKPRKKKEAKP